MWIGSQLGRAYIFSEMSMEGRPNRIDFQMRYRQSDSFIVLRMIGIINQSKGRELHSNVLSEDTLSVLRDGRNNGNEIRENS